MSWKSHPYDAQGVLYLLQPDVVLKARVNLADASYPVAVIPYDGVSEGSIDDVRMGMTVLIGSSDGAWDRGSIYVRADADGVIGGLTTINIGYCSRGSRRGEVELVNDSYITVLDTYDVWKRASRFVEGEGNYKDYELDGLDPLPVAHLGGIGGLASMGIVSGGVLTLSFDSSGAYATAPGAALAATAWDVGDGTITVGSDTDAAITATFPAGKRWIRLLKQQVDTLYSLPRMHLVVALASESSGVQTMHRARLRLTPEGATFNCDVKERLNPASYPPGTIAIWWVRERYAGVEGSVTGYAVKFAGYVTGMQGYGRGTRTGWERGTTLTAVDVAGRMAMVRANASSLMREDTVTNSNQVVGANLDRYAWWLLSWHTTVPLLTDFTWRGVDHPFTAFSSAGGDFYKAVDGVCRAAGMRLTMDSRGRLAMVDDPLLRDDGERTDTVLQTLAPGDITRIDRVAKPYPAVGMMRATAALESTIAASYYDDDAHDAPPEVHGKAPGDVDGQGAGTAQNGEPWLVPDVLTLYARLGHALKRQNGEEDALKIALAHGGDGGIEPARMAWVDVSTDDDTVGWGDPALTDERCLVLATEYQFDDAAGTMRQTITVERETFGTPGIQDDVAGPDTQQPVDDGGFPLWTGALPTKMSLASAENPTFTLVTGYTLDLTGGVVTLLGEDRSGNLAALGVTSCIWYVSDPWHYRRVILLTDVGICINDDITSTAAVWTLAKTNLQLFGDAGRVGHQVFGDHKLEGWFMVLCGGSGAAVTLNTFSSVTAVALDGGTPDYSESANHLGAAFIYPHDAGRLLSVVRDALYASFYTSSDGGLNWTFAPLTSFGTQTIDTGRARLDPGQVAISIPYKKAGGADNTVAGGLLVDVEYAQVPIATRTGGLAFRSTDGGANYADADRGSSSVAVSRKVANGMMHFTHDAAYLYSLVFSTTTAAVRATDDDDATHTDSPYFPSAGEARNALIVQGTSSTPAFCLAASSRASGTGGDRLWMTANSGADWLSADLTDLPGWGADEGVACAQVELYPLIPDAAP